jgi:hypothetical protein
MTGARSSTWRLNDFWPYFSENDQLVDVDLFGRPARRCSQQDEQQREAGQALLPVHDVADALLLADDDGAEEVVRIVGHFAARVRRLVFLQELVAEVVNQFADLLFVPLVLPLVVVNRIFDTL